jgi:two-component system, chemotaxis family, chemotaxis protein CheY
MSLKVLLADDSGTMRKIIIRSLEAVGITDTTEAKDGEECLAKFAQHSFDFVITDWNMPGKSGLEVAKGIRAAGSKVPIFMVTTESERARVLEAVQAGVTDYLVKPFTQEALREKLDKYAPAAR